MRLTMRTNLAMRTLMACAANPGRMLTKGDIARACNASEHHVAQVVHALGQAGFVSPRRGRGGGLRLARTPEAIRVGDVVRHFESPVPFAECFAGDANTCPLTAACRLRDAFAAALDAFYTALDRVTLLDLVGGNVVLGRLLAVGPTRAPACVRAA
ncbi:MAG: Rrf2 family transcriptional regulator [Rhodobacteraceae bacterium]|nr:Rrf2 family transcriptional regulator [Paracoccaceae bacterium]